MREMDDLARRIEHLEGAMDAVVGALTAALSAVDPTSHGATRLLHDELEEHGFGAFASDRRTDHPIGSEDR